jgi:hypothetical protein
MLTPAVTRNSSEPRCDAPLTPPEAKRMSPGFDFASCTSSATDFAGSEGCTATTKGCEPTMVTALMSRCTSKGSFLYSAGA